MSMMKKSVSVSVLCSLFEGLSNEFQKQKTKSDRLTFKTHFTSNQQH